MEINIEHEGKCQERSNIKGNKLSRMKCIRCPECNEEILMVPTLGKMIEAIENHVSMHKRQPNICMTMDRPKAPSICINLTEQVLQQASAITDLPNKPSFWL